MVDERLEFLESLDDSRLIDPLNEVTRKERRALLGTSLLTLAIVWGNLVPKEIKALDIKIEASEEAGLFLSLSVALLYFILARSRSPKSKKSSKDMVLDWVCVSITGRRQACDRNTSSSRSNTN